MIVTIGDNQWTCTLASTTAELSQGLSGLESLPAGQGMLFDLGFDCSRIDINMSEMLFPLDIVFINSNLTVVGVLHDVNPGDEAYFLASNSLGARYFMEVNAGEAASVNVGDVVTFVNGPGGSDINTILALVVLSAVIAIVARITIKMLRSPEGNPLLTKNNPHQQDQQDYYWRITDQNLGEVHDDMSPFRSRGGALRDALGTWTKELRKPFPSTEAGEKALLIEVYDKLPGVKGAKVVLAAKATTESGVTPA